MLQQMVHAMWAMFGVFIVLVAFDLSPTPRVTAQVPYRRYLSNSRIEELRKLADRLEISINRDKYACEGFFDYVCSHYQPLFSILGHQPEAEDLVELVTALQNDEEDLQPKQKLMDFITSCTIYKSVDDCHREAFEYFKPVFGYIIVKKYIVADTQEHQTFMELLRAFLEKAQHTTNFHRYPTTLTQIDFLRKKFNNPSVFFRPYDLEREYRNLSIYRDGYEHNLRNLDEFRKQNSSYVIDVHRTMLDWSLYLYQSRHKPMSYYYSTLNVHLWMSLYNNTERLREPEQMKRYAECLSLPSYVSTLTEARLLAIVYLKSYRNAWDDYRKWVESDAKGRYEQENDLLKQYQLSNDRLFFTFYAQNFCEFGKKLSEEIFYIGLYENQDFFDNYSCGLRTVRGKECF